MYDAREKASLDIQSNLIDARQEGRREGRQEGIEIGEQRGEQRGKLKASVQIYEGLLGESVTSDSELNNQTIESLEAMVAQLQKRLRNRTS
jgi:flagellar biosynthesis/type III secretory pathway protein FliH